jgi:hypothetical protein
MLAIAIILGVGVFGQIVTKKGDYNLASGSALVVSLFALNTPLAIVVLSLLSVITLFVIVTYKVK